MTDDGMSALAMADTLSTASRFAGVIVTIAAKERGSRRYEIADFLYHSDCVTVGQAAREDYIFSARALPQEEAEESTLRPEQRLNHASEAHGQFVLECLKQAHEHAMHLGTLLSKIDGTFPERKLRWNLETLCATVRNLEEAGLVHLAGLRISAIIDSKEVESAEG